MFTLPLLKNDGKFWLGLDFDNNYIKSIRNDMKKLDRKIVQKISGRRKLT